MDGEELQKKIQEERAAIVANLNRRYSESGMSKMLFAAFCGFSSTTMSAWLNGKSRPSRSAIIKLAAAFCCRPDDLLIPPAKTEVEATLDGLSIRQWRNRALRAEKILEIDKFNRELQIAVDAAAKSAH